jgi:hypothetical protein
MIFVNQNQQEKNSAIKDPMHCTWACHNDTDYCIKNHNKIIKGDFLIFTNRIYDGIVRFLSSVKGGYQVMNILFLVVGIPLMIWLLLISAIDKYLKIKRLSK